MSYQIGDVPRVRADFTDRDTGLPTDPTTVTLQILSPSGVVTTPAATNDASVVGGFYYDLALTESGTWTYRFVGTGAVAAADEATLHVERSSFIDDGPPLTSSSICSPWATLANMPTDCAEMDVELATDMLLVASELLYEKSGRQFPGICTATVWPCAQRISGCFPSYPSRCTWGRSYSIVTLGIQPIVDVSEVIVDGEVLSPTLYRIDNYRELVRLDNADGTSDVWPRDDETFRVTFTYGQNPPNLGMLAAASLACQLGLRFSGDEECKLPDNVQSISRQGVTMTLINEFNSVQKLGIAEVGLFLDTYNPQGLRRRASVWSPDMARVRRVNT